jgi:NADPH-dependent glutamate synthase beta subunit-like oxidoreductase
VYLAVGAARPKRLPNLPDRARWLMDGAEYLARSAAGTPPALGRRLVVVGGGSAAMDVARSARRAAHDVTILSLERAEQMPAQREELVEALEEGIALMDRAMLTAVTPKTGSGLSLSCMRVVFEPGATRGQFTVKPVAGSDFELAADAVVVAIGQDADLSALSQRLPVEGGLLAVGERQATSADGVWAGGDVASMARFVTEAIGMGKRAALDIDRVLRGASADEAEWERPVGIANIATWYHPKHARAAELLRPAGERVATGLEVQLGLELEQALEEAGRCFSCGECTHCDNCFHYCPDLAIRRVDGGYEVLADYCKGCGICVKECPTGSMTMLEESK